MVHNDENAYTGESTLTNATAYSDNSVYAEVGLQVGTQRIARLAHAMGITTPISTNPAMTIGGLKIGVTPIDMAHAYETLAHGGQRVSGTLAEPGMPVGIEEVSAEDRMLPDGGHRELDQTVLHRVVPQSTAETETGVLETVLQYGTAKSAALGQFAAGKTGTTSNYGDAWFVGWDRRYTVAVWVGFPNSLVPMTTEFDGGPVLGGTYPALIWHSFMVAAMGIEKQAAEEAREKAAGSAAAKGRRTLAGEGEGAASETAPAPLREATPAPHSHRGAATPAPSSEKTEKPEKPEKAEKDLNSGAGGAQEGSTPQARNPQPSSPAQGTQTPAPSTPASKPAEAPAPAQTPAQPEAASPAPPANGGTGSPTGGAAAPG